MFFCFLHVDVLTLVHHLSCFKRSRSDLLNAWLFILNKLNVFGVAFLWFSNFFISVSGVESELSLFPLWWFQSPLLQFQLYFSIVRFKFNVNELLVYHKGLSTSSIGVRSLGKLFHKKIIISLVFRTLICVVILQVMRIDVMLRTSFCVQHNFTFRLWLLESHLWKVRWLRIRKSKESIDFNLFFKIVNLIISHQFRVFELSSSPLSHWCFRTN